MAAELNNIHTETNWSAEWFVPVEAEVEVASGRRRSRRLRDMLTAIRLNRRDRLFIVLGDPGAGKSVALRVLCERLIREVTTKTARFHSM
jgi:type II secretory pathway predicted ATPase ExeA